MNSNTLWWRALIALVLMVGFYAFAIAIAVGLLAIPWLEWTETNRVHIKIALFCVIGAGIILWSIFPRRDEFTPPGPRLTAAEHPELFAELRDIAARVGQSMPREVYLLPDMNAWVMERGGAMGIGSRRVMGLGLPLLGSLTVAELRAVLVHEFGHFDGGDTKLGPWVYKTRSAIVRTVEGLDNHSGILKAIFSAYAHLFLRVSLAVSRAQEFAADRLAAMTVGARPLIDGLKTIHRLGPAQQAYWEQEVTPVLSAGFLPDFDAGFRRFLKSPEVREGLERLEQHAATAQADPYDTHPPLNARIEAVSGLEVASSVAPDDRSAMALLDPDYDAARNLIAALTPPEYMASVKEISWDEVAAKVHAPHWQNEAAHLAHRLMDISFGDLVERVKDPGALAERFVHPEAADLDGMQKAQVAAHVIGVTTAVALLNRGGVLRSEIGMPEVITVDGIDIRPFMLARDLALGDITPERWAEICAGLGITDLALGEAAREPGVETCPKCGVALEAEAEYCIGCGGHIVRGSG